MMDRVYPRFDDLGSFTARLGFATVICRIDQEFATVTFGGGTPHDYCNRSHINRSLEIMGLPTLGDLAGIPSIYESLGDFYFYKTFTVSREDANRLYDYLIEETPIYVTNEQWDHVYDNDVVCIEKDKSKGYYDIIQDTRISNKQGISMGCSVYTDVSLGDLYIMNGTSSMDLDDGGGYKLLMDGDGVCYVAETSCLDRMKPIVDTSVVHVTME